MDASLDIATGFLLAGSIYWLTIGCEIIIRAFRMTTEPEVGNG
jgi:hypothetical protein